MSILNRDLLNKLLGDTELTKETDSNWYTTDTGGLLSRFYGSNENSIKSSVNILDIGNSASTIIRIKNNYNTKIGDVKIELYLNKGVSSSEGVLAETISLPSIESGEEVIVSAVDYPILSGPYKGVIFSHNGNRTDITEGNLLIDFYRSSYAPSPIKVGEDGKYSLDVSDKMSGQTEIVNSLNNNWYVSSSAGTVERFYGADVDSLSVTILNIVNSASKIIHIKNNYNGVLSNVKIRLFLKGNVLKSEGIAEKIIDLPNIPAGGEMLVSAQDYPALAGPYNGVVFSHWATASEITSGSITVDFYKSNYLPIPSYVLDDDGKPVIRVAQATLPQGFDPDDESYEVKDVPARNSLSNIDANLSNNFRGLLKEYVEDTVLIGRSPNTPYYFGEAKGSTSSLFVPLDIRKYRTIFIRTINNMDQPVNLRLRGAKKTATGWEVNDFLMENQLLPAGDKFLFNHIDFPTLEVPYEGILLYVQIGSTSPSTGSMTIEFYGGTT